MYTTPVNSVGGVIGNSATPGRPIRYISKDKRFYDLNNPEPIRMEGWLDKRGKRVGWRTRYFVLAGRVLHQFKPYDLNEVQYLKEKPRKALDVATCTLSTRDFKAPLHIKPEPHCFTLHTSQDGYVFKAPSAPEYSQWLEVLSSHNASVRKDFGIHQKTQLPPPNPGPSRPLAVGAPPAAQYGGGRPPAPPLGSAQLSGYSSLDSIMMGNSNVPITASTVTSSAGAPQVYDPREALKRTHTPAQIQPQQPVMNYVQSDAEAAARLAAEAERLGLRLAPADPNAPPVYARANSMPYAQQPNPGYAQPLSHSADIYLPSAPTTAVVPTMSDQYGRPIQAAQSAFVPPTPSAYYQQQQQQRPQYAGMNMY